MKGKVLVLDDDELTLETVRATLEAAGFEADTVLTTREARGRLEEGTYDVAVVDLGMPDVSGPEMLQWMQQHAPEVTPVALSDTASPEEALDAVQHGAFDFVSKPIRDTHDFCHHIQRAVNHKRLTDSHTQLLEALQEKNVELENRLGQLELAHSVLQSQAVALQDEVNRAMRIQRGLLPKALPFADRVSICAVYRPAGKVGGDLYDLFRVDEDRLGLYIADTSGHGMSAAMLTVFLKHFMLPAARGRPLEPGASPGDTLRELNHALIYEGFGRGMFISMVYLVVDTRSMEVRFASAGHRPLFVKRQEGAIERLRVPAPVLGVNPNVKFTEDTFTLHAGDVLVLHTDGITEARNRAGELYGEDRLKEAIAAAESHADAVGQRIEDALERFCAGQPFVDDVTLLVMGCEPQRTPFQAPEMPEVREAAPLDEAATGKVLTASHNRRTLIAVWGSGSWQESQRILELCEKARANREGGVVLDLAHCTHLDSTFLGMLHEIAVDFDQDPSCRFEIQNIPEGLLAEMSELGLTAVLMHFRPEPSPLPESMRPLKADALSRTQMGRLLLRAHEALVDADPRNADRFADVLKVLHEHAEGKR